MTAEDPTAPIFRNLALEMYKAGSILRDADPITARKIWATLHHMESACLTLLPKPQKVQRNLIAHGLNTRSMRVIYRLPEHSDVEYRIPNDNLEWLLSWIEPDELSACARRGLALTAGFPAFIILAGQDPAFKSVLLNDFIRRDVESDNSPWHNVKHYLTGDPLLVAELLRHQVAIAPEQMRDVVTNILARNYSAVPAIACILAGAEVVPPQHISAQMRSEMIELNELVKSSHGILKVHRRHGTLEDYISSLPRSDFTPIRRDGWRMPPLTSAERDPGIKGLQAVFAESILCDHNGVMDDDLFKILSDEANSTP